MGREIEDKVERVLSIYTRLEAGEVIYKLEESKKFDVNPRTIQRDIADIQKFLENVGSQSEIRGEIIFDRKLSGYRLVRVVSKSVKE